MLICWCCLLQDISEEVVYAEPNGCCMSSRFYCEACDFQSLPSIHRILRRRCVLLRISRQRMSTLMEAITAGDCGRVKQLIVDKPPGQEDVEEGLFAACAAPCEVCAEVMLQAGASPDAHDPDYYTPLTIAASRGAIKVLRLLLEWDSQQVNLPAGPQSNTALHLAASEGYLDCCQSLCAAGANVNAQNMQEDTPMILAAMHGHLPIVRYLLQNHASIRKRGYHERTALHCAAENGHLSLCRFLVSAKADLEEEDTFGNTPLICAAEKGLAELLQLLLAHGCDVNRMSHSAATALHYAAQHGAAHCCKLLLEAGAEIDAQDIRRFTPLMMAALNGHVDVVRQLIAWKCNVNMAAYNRRTALHLAAERGKQECCELLLDAGACIDAQDALGASPLHAAVMKGQLQVMQFLIASGADTTRRPNNGNTLIHLAAAGGSELCCQELLAHGFDIDEQNSDGNTPLFCAVHAKQIKTANFLLESGCNVNERGQHGMTALNEAAFIGHIPLLKTLLQHGANPGLEDDVGTLPLWFAVDSWSLETVRLLLACGSPFHISSCLNPQCGPCCPLQHAAHRQRDIFVNWLLAVYGEEAANHLRQSLPKLENCPNVRPSSLHEWKELVDQPQPLLVQSRCAIRKLLPKDKLLCNAEDLQDLNVPQVLRNYINLSELPDMKSAETC